MERELLAATDFLGYPISDLSKSEILQAIDEVSERSGVFLITVMNTNKMYLYDKSPLCKYSIEESFIILPENAINIGRKVLGKPLKSWDIGGADIAKELLFKSSRRIFLLGATQEVQDIIFQKSEIRCKLVGGKNGYFDNDELQDIVSQINRAKPDVILIAMGSPRQEELMQYLKKKLEKGILMGVGGTLDVVAGNKKDAPKWTKRGLEWLYRSFQDPKKFKRYMIVNPYYVFRFTTYLLQRIAGENNKR